jgi:cell division protein FtsL
MTPPPAAAPLVDEPRRAGVLGALASALPDRGRRHAEGPDLRVVQPVTRRRRSWQVGMLAGGLLFTAMFLIVGAQTMIVQRQQHIDEVNDRIAAASEEAEQLKIDLAQLQSPERIMTEAKGRLGMVPAPPPVYLQPRLDDDSRAAEVPPASPPTTVAPTATTTAKSSTKATTPTTTAKSTASTTTPTTAARSTATTPTTVAGRGR